LVLGITNAEAFVIVHLLSNHAAALRMDKNVLRRVEDELDWVSVTGRMLAVMDEMATRMGKQDGQTTG
jgi:hypothetical protein